MKDYEIEACLEILNKVNSGEIKAWLIGNGEYDQLFLLSNGWLAGVFFDNYFPDDWDYMNCMITPSGERYEFWPESGGPIEQLTYFNRQKEMWSKKLDLGCL